MPNRLSGLSSIMRIIRSVNTQEIAKVFITKTKLTDDVQIAGKQQLTDYHLLQRTFDQVLVSHVHLNEQ